MTRGPFRPLALVLALLLGALGCGGSDSGEERERSTAPAEAPTKREFIAAADRVCARTKRMAERINKPRNPDELVRSARRLVRLHRETVAGLERIGLPRGEDRQGAQRFLRSIRELGGPVERVEQSAERLEQAVERRNRESVEDASLALNEALIDIRQGDRRSHRIARAYGLKKCAEEDEEKPREPRGSQRKPS